MPDDLRARLAAFEAKLRAEAAWKRQAANERFGHADAVVREDAIRQDAYAAQLLADADELAAHLREPPAGPLERLIASAMREKARMFRHDAKARRALPTAADGLEHFASDIEAGLWRDFLPTAARVAAPEKSDA